MSALRDLAKERPNGAQLATWRALEQAAEQRRRAARAANKERRRQTWWRWALGFKPRQARFVSTHTTHRDRAQLCAEHRVPNSGRQWRKLRKALARIGRAEGAA